MRVVRRILGVWLSLWATAVLTGVVLKFTWRPDAEPSNPSFSLVSIFDGVDFRPTTSELTTSKALTFFGGTKLDLRRADTSAPVIHLDLTTVMGGTDVTVPDTWRVTVQGPAMAGGHEIHVADHESLDPDATHLIIRARTVMGGLRVQARPVLSSAKTG